MQSESLRASPEPVDGGCEEMKRKPAAKEEYSASRLLVFPLDAQLKLRQ
jgi:hypothetical protein